MKTDKGGIENSNLKKLITPGAFSSPPNYNYLVKSFGVLSFFLPGIRLCMSHTCIKCDRYVKHYDLIIDTNLSWKIHLQELLSKKLSKGIGVPSRVYNCITLLFIHF